MPSQELYGKQEVCCQSLRCQVRHVDRNSEFILKNILDHARDVLAQYDPSKGLPDPSFTLQLSDEVYSSSNLWAVQKLFDGPFQFDVYYESESAKHPLVGKQTGPSYYP